MANEVQRMSVCVYKMPTKGQETRQAANYPDMNPKIRAISLCCNHSSDVLTRGKEVDGVGSWLQTLPSCPMQSPGGISDSPRPKPTLRDSDAFGLESGWLTQALFKSPPHDSNVCVWRETGLTTKAKIFTSTVHVHGTQSYFILCRRQQHLYWISKNWFL